jgi:hypothetical protein
MQLLRANHSLKASFRSIRTAMAQDGARPLMDTHASTQIDYQSYQGRWDAIWTAGEGLKPGEAWDKSGASPGLAKLLTEVNGDIKGKRVVVPGCGRGYDLVAFADAGAEFCLGMEISEHAISSALSYIASTPHASTCTVKLIDFLRDPAPESFDFGYDYTMLCALHPSLREQWADAWTRSIKPSGGQLIVLVYPDDPEREAEKPGLGPPYTLHPDIYDTLLLHRGWKRTRMDRMPPELSHPGRENKEWIGIYSRILISKC